MGVISAPLVPFTISPEPFCKVEYSCNNVVRKDGEASLMDCGDLNFPPNTKDCATEACTIEFTTDP